MTDKEIVSAVYGRREEPRKPERLQPAEPHIHEAGKVKLVAATRVQLDELTTEFAEVGIVFDPDIQVCKWCGALFIAEVKP